MSSLSQLGPEKPRLARDGRDHGNRVETLSLEAGKWCCFQKAGRVGGGEESEL